MMRGDQGVGRTPTTTPDFIKNGNAQPCKRCGIPDGQSTRWYRLDVNADLKRWAKTVRCDLKRDWVCQGCYMAVTPTVRYPPVFCWGFECSGTTLCVLCPPYVGDCGIWWMQGAARGRHCVGCL